MSGELEGVMGYFTSSAALATAVERTREALYLDAEAYLPVEDEAAIEETSVIGSLVRYLCIGGGVAGLALGLWLTIWASRDYPLVTGGKPIVSLPPFLVVAFELGILGAAIGAVLGFLILSGLPNLRPSSAYHQDLAIDQFALLLRSRPGFDSARAETLLRECGAVRVRQVMHEDRGILGGGP